MIAGTIFPDVQAELSWVDYLHAVTPVDQGPDTGLLYKREDTFAPLGYGGINGAKLRQCIWLMQHMQPEHPVITACSVLSPQAPMVAMVGRHMGHDVHVMYGATHREAALRHENVQIAVRAGARLEFTKVAYNPALQRAAHAWAVQHDGQMLSYGITTPGGSGAPYVRAFHEVAMPQAISVPNDTRTVIVPFGSANSAVGVLMGLARYGPGTVSRVVLVGIGPNRLSWLTERAAMIAEAGGIDIRQTYGLVAHHGAPDGLGRQWRGMVALEHYDLHGTGYVRYSDKRPWRQDGIDFHPTYEGKIMHWLHRYEPHWFTPRDGRTLFWIVGSQPSLAAMEGHLS
jgi:1-aminocyclopropane-1-carboxylate deaminase/D-cysteine desulfhydrase-like pyridoxal-dependent ACC family enzyme